MFNLWKWSTIIFVLQVISGGIAYYAFGARLWDAAGVAAVVAMFIILFALLTECRTGAYVAFLAAGAAAVMAHLIFACTGGCQIIFFVTIAIVIIAFVAVAALLGNTEDDPLSIRFLAALPAGFGTFFGGLALLSRRLWRWRRRSASEA